MWVILAFISAFFNGCYDISKKIAVNNNAILPVLFFSALFAFLLLLPVAILSYLGIAQISASIFYIPNLSIESHIHILIRAFIIVLAWILGYTALKHLPITITGPINSTRPVITLVLSIVIFNENLSVCQWIGVLITIVSLFLLSFSSKREGVKFSKNKWITFAFSGALIGSLCELLEKFIMQQLAFMSVLFWTSLYQCTIVGLIILFSKLFTSKKKYDFSLRWSILFIAIFLTLTDVAYLNALSLDGAMISVISLIRRGSVLVSFTGGVIFLKEKNFKSKVLDLVLIIIGMMFLFFGTI